MARRRTCWAWPTGWPPLTRPASRRTRRWHANESSKSGSTKPRTGKKVWQLSRSGARPASPAADGKAGRPPMPVLERPAGNIRYQVTGNAGPALLLSHGFGATSAMFAGNVPALADTHRVVTWDLRGHGGSEYPADP